MKRTREEFLNWYESIWRGSEHCLVPKPSEIYDYLSPPSVNEVSAADIISEACDRYAGRTSDDSLSRVAFGLGAKWMRSKLQSKPKDGGE